MARSFKLPDLGEGIHEGEIIAVLISPGEEVKEGQPILEVETDKATVQIPSPFTGTVEGINAKPGDVVKVGDVLVSFSGEGPVEAAKPRGKPKAAVPEKPAVPEAAPSPEGGPVPASPATRRLARELGVDLRQVPPTGPAGLVTAEDVRAFSARKEVKEVEAPRVPEAEAMPVQPFAVEVPPLPDFKRWGAVERVPLRSIRRATARQMALSWSQIPHVSSYDVVDITALEAFRQKHKAEIEARGGRLTMTVFALKAAVAALKAYPRFNASIDPKAGEIVLKNYYHIGVAVDTDNGLVVPVIRDVDRKSIIQLGIELHDLTERTRARKATPEDMQGGTFTITNIGALGGTGFAPIINYPEVAILGIAQSRLQPIVQGDENNYQIVPRLMLPLILAFDHRVVDGADAARFMQVVMDAMQDPDSLLLMMV